MELRLPPEKLVELQTRTRQWRSKKASTKRDLLSLIGKLAHAATIVKPGRTFLRRMLDAAHSVGDLNHYIKLKSDFKSDLAWWESFYFGTWEWVQYDGNTSPHANTHGSMAH